MIIPNRRPWRSSHERCLLMRNAASLIEISRFGTGAGGAVAVAAVGARPATARAKRIDAAPCNFVGEREHRVRIKRGAVEAVRKNRVQCQIHSLALRPFALRCAPLD